MQKKIKVAIVLHGLGAGGISVLFANLAKEWDYDRFDITYFLGVDKGAKQFLGESVEKTKTKVIHITDLDGFKLFKWPFMLYKNLKEYGPFDVIHVNMDMLNGVNLLVGRLAGIDKRVCHAHNSGNTIPNGKFKSLIKDLYIKSMKVLIRIYATDRIACSSVSGEYFFPKLTYKVIFNGIDVPMYRRDYNVNCAGGGRFVTVAKISDQKNPLFLVDIIKELSKRISDFSMTWVGGGDMEDIVHEKVREYGIEDKIDFLGIRDDVCKILKKNDYFLMPSKFEGLSLALAEAQAAGLICFVSDTVSRQSDCGKCRFISLEKSASQWADEICAFINSGKKIELSEDSLKNFDIKHTAEELEKVYS